MEGQEESKRNGQELSTQAKTSNAVTTTATGTLELGCTVVDRLGDGPVSWLWE